MHITYQIKKTQKRKTLVDKKSLTLYNKNL